MLPLLLIATLVVLIYWGTKQIRYGSGREVILNLFCYIQGRNHKWVSDPSLARRLLHSSSSKGIGIEQLLSTQAFSPIISLESVNDEQWSRMKDNFTLLKTHFPSLDSIARIAEELSKQYLEGEDHPIIDCPTLSKLIVEIMTTWLFGQQEDVSPKLIAAIDEWRKEIAVKGKGDADLKLYAVNWIQDKIRENTKYYDIFHDKWFSDEYWSLLLQPLIVSPVINITDLAVTLSSSEFKKEFNVDADLFKTDKAEMERIILCGINYNHPFPVLERWFPDGLKEENGEFIIEPNTHVFLPVDKIGRISCSNSKPSSWTAFGAGKRACGGKEIALTTCINMFHTLLSHPQSKSKFKPWINHKYSGRDNDETETWSQTSFQIKLLIKILWKLVLHKNFEGVSWIVQCKDNKEEGNKECHLRLIIDKSHFICINSRSNEDSKMNMTSPDIETDLDISDRKRKYGIGTLRLSFLILILTWFDSGVRFDFLRLTTTYGLFGIGGALLNLHKLSKNYQLVILLVLIYNFIHEYHSIDGSDKRRSVLFMYFFKTLLGDALSGKLDNIMWFKFIGIVLICWTLLSSQLSLLPSAFEVIDIFQIERLVFIPHLVCHWLCEMGDNYFEDYVFFRHRYSYEISCIILYFLSKNSDTGRLLLFSDMFAALLYRVTNYIYLCRSTK